MKCSVMGDWTHIVKWSDYYSVCPAKFTQYPSWTPDAAALFIYLFKLNASQKELNENRCRPLISII